MSVIEETIYDTNSNDAKCLASEYRKFMTHTSKLIFSKFVRRKQQNGNDIANSHVSYKLIRWRMHLSCLVNDSRPDNQYISYKTNGKK